MIKVLSYQHIPAIAKVHVEALAGDFLPTLGESFLKTFYDGVIGQEGVFAFVDIEEEEVVGFIIGTKDSSFFFRKALYSNPFLIVFKLLLSLLKNPTLLKKIIETFLYPRKDTGVKAELVVIAILNRFQGKGLGRKLINTLDKEFIKNKVKSYKLTVYQDKQAVSFYEHLKFKRQSEFKLYDKMWYIYEKQLKKS